MSDNRLKLKRADQLLSKFQLSKSSAISDDIAYFDIAIAGDIVRLTPNGSFCLGKITISLEELSGLSEKYLKCDKEFFLLELCGDKYNRI